MRLWNSAQIHALNIHSELSSWANDLIFEQAQMYIYILIKSMRATITLTKAFAAHTHSIVIELWHDISNNLVCATSKASDQPAHTRSLIRAFASCLSILWLLSY